MPIIDPEGPGRDVSQGFGADAARYHRARPSYPSALIDQLAAAIPAAHRTVLDVGTGTGIAAAQLRERGLAVVGVEPDERMAALARQGGTEVEIARFEDWDPAGRAFGAVTAAQAWHWVDMDAGAAKAAQALAPGGLLAVFWNSFLPPARVNAAIGAAYQRVPGLPAAMARGLPGPDGYRLLCDKAAAAIDGCGAFGKVAYWRFDWERTITREEWLDGVPTFGGWGRIPAGLQQEILQAMGQAVDDAGGEVQMGYATVAVAAVRA